MTIYICIYIIFIIKLKGGKNEIINNNITENNMENSKTNEEKYKAVIEEYKTALKDTNIEEMLDVDQKYPYINAIMVIEKIRANKNNDDYNFDIEYAYYDVDKNGTDELIMLANYNDNNSEIIDIYSYDSKNNKPLKIIDDFSLGYRAHANIYNNGIIHIQGSSGADNGIIEFTKILLDGYSVDTVKYYYKYEDENTLTFYNSYNDMENKKNKLSYTSFEEIEKLNIKDSREIELKVLTKNKI